jgi:hypothetical protein
MGLGLAVPKPDLVMIGETISPKLKKLIGMDISG